MTIFWKNVFTSVTLILGSTAILRAADRISVRSELPTGSQQSLYGNNRRPLQPASMIKLPIGSIHPDGWLRGQLELERNGMGGHLEEISPFLKWEGSGWVNPADKGGWEEVPYWIRGYGDLGYVLNDPKIIAEASKWINAIIATQTADGWFGPTGLKTSLNGKPDMWPNMPVLNAMQSYYEFTGDSRVIPFMTNYFKWQDTLDPHLFSGDWQDTRFGDNIESIYWLYNRTGGEWLLTLATKMHENSAKWSRGVANWHNVNFAQGFREPTEYWMQTKDPALLGTAEKNYQTAMAAYGQFPGGGFAADENARRGFHDPRQGFETCGIVEFMRSFEMLSKISGDPTWLDRCEYIAFNSLPAALTSDAKALHYLTPANVVQLDQHNKAPGIDNHNTMFSYSPLEVYRCCQHNHVMGWPLYAEHLWMATSDGGLCAALYNASDVSAKVGDGSKVQITENTDYPFTDTIIFNITTEKAVQFPLYLRMPGWAQTISLQVNGKPVDVQPTPRQYICINRAWSTGDRVTLQMPMSINVQRWEQNGNSASVNYGPLSFSLRIGEKYVKYGGTSEWPEQGVYASTPWNYGLILNQTNPASSFEIIRKTGPVAAQPFTESTTPIELRAKGARIAQWTMDKNSLLRTMQESPTKTDAPAEPITLIPMGAARLRISAFPVIGSESDAHVWIDPKATAGMAMTAQAKASFCFGSDTVQALNSGESPASSHDDSIPRLTFWDHKGTTEWIEYDFKKSISTSGVGVYWFDDGASHGNCRVPQSWHLFYRDGQTWKPVEPATGYNLDVDNFNDTKFKSVNTDALRIQMQLQPDFSSGVLQWQVRP